MIKFLIPFLLILNVTLSTCIAAVLDKTNPSSDAESQKQLRELIGLLITQRESERSFENGRDPFGASPALSRLVEGYKTIYQCSKKLIFYGLCFGIQILTAK